jgi:hypothetical protein
VDAAPSCILVTTPGNLLEHAVINFKTAVGLLVDLLIVRDREDSHRLGVGRFAKQLDILLFGALVEIARFSIGVAHTSMNRIHWASFQDRLTTFCPTLRRVAATFVKRILRIPLRRAGRPSTVHPWHRQMWWKASRPSASGRPGIE